MEVVVSAPKGLGVYRELERDERMRSKSGSLKGQEGHTLIELIVSIVILGFALLGLLSLFFNLSVNNVKTKYRTAAYVLGNELLEEIKSKRFDERTAKDASFNWSTLGIDTGETSGTLTTYDDVDDYNGLSQTAPSPNTGFTRAVTVSYVNPSDLNTAVGTIDQNYKRVSVVVTVGGVTYATLNTIITPTREEIGS